MDNHNILYRMPTPQWHCDLDEMNYYEMDPISSSEAKEYMTRIAEIFSSADKHPTILYGMADLPEDAIGQIEILEGLVQEEGSYSFVITFNYDGVYLDNEFGSVVEGGSIEEVYDYFKAWLNN